MAFFQNLFSKNKKTTKQTTPPEAARPSAPKRPSPDVNQPVENTRLKGLLEKWRENGSEENTNNVLEEIVLRAWTGKSFIRCSPIGRSWDVGRGLLRR